MQRENITESISKFVPESEVTLIIRENKWQDRFDEKFNALGYDNFDTCSCGFMEECTCISGRDKLKYFIQLEIDLAIKEERARVQEAMNEFNEKWNNL